MQVLLGNAIAFRGFRHGKPGKTHLLAGPQLAKGIKVRLDYLRDLRIAADRLAIDTDDDALAVARHLDGTGANRLGSDFPFWHSQRRSRKAQPHPVARRGYAERLRVERSVLEPSCLQSRQHADCQHVRLGKFELGTKSRPE